MDDILDNIEDYNEKIMRKVLPVFDNMISHIMSNKKSSTSVKELCIRCRKLSTSCCF